MVIAVAAYKIAYMALPKAACSSVKAALAAIDPDVSVPAGEDQDQMTWHRIYPTRRFRPHRWATYADHWRFCVVRDPVDRLMSAYLDRVVARRELHHSRRIGHGGFAHLTPDPDPDFFFRHLWDYVEAASVVKHHFSDAWLFLGPGPIMRHYDAIFRVEDLDQLAGALGGICQRPVTIPRVNRGLAGRLSLDDLRPETIDSLRDYLDREYAYLSDFYQNPLR